MPSEGGRIRRVLMTADAVGGVWRYSIDLAAALAGRGVETIVAVMGPPPRDAQRAEAERRGISVVERHCKLEWMDDPWADVERAGPWLLELEHALEPDIVHLNGYCHAALPWHAPALVVGHSCVRSWWRGVHGDEPPASWDHYTEEVSRGLQAAALVVAPTAAMLADLARDYGPFRATTVIPNGSPAGEGGADHEKQDLVFSAGRIWDPAKNIDALCAIAPLLPWPVFIAGDHAAPGGDCATTGYVRHLGFLGEREIEGWYGRAAIYALPARYEPFGLSVLEAAARGCALVLGDVRTLRENWSGAAVFVPTDNRRALACAIQSLIDDPARRADLAARAKARAARFTIAAMADGYLAAYAALLRPAIAA